MNSALIKLVLEKGDFGAMQSAALILFVCLMMGITVWIFWPGSKEYYEKIATDLIKGDR